MQYQNAYECYNYYWQNDPAFQDQPMRDPRKLPKLRKIPHPPSIDPNPEEEPDEQQSQQKRRRRATSSSFTDFSAAVSDHQSQFANAEKEQPGANSGNEICTKEYLLGIGVMPHTYLRDD